MFVFNREFPTSSDYYVEALSLDKTWSGGAGHSANVSYSFEFANSDIIDTFFVGLPQELSTVEQETTRDILQDISNIANITFTETLDEASADMIIRKGALGEFFAGLTFPITAFFSDFLLTGADVVIADNLGALTEGSFAYSTLIHEIGHGIGLDHPHEGVRLPSAEDTQHLTLMSYNLSTINEHMEPASMMLYDIAALQFLYGTNTSFNSGNTTLTPNSFPVITDFASILTNQVESAVGYAIWDGGGTDTFDISAISTIDAMSVTIDLREGKDFYSNLGDIQYYWMAFGANIENAIGHTLTSDLITGNDLNNVLDGLGGNDTLFGGLANDTLVGGDGNDALNGNQGADNVSGGNGNDTVIGGKDDDAVNGNQGDDSIDGSIGADTLSGGKGNDTILGGNGNDVLVGDLGNDFISGGADNDRLSGSGGNDTVRGGKGNDTLFGGDGDDFIYGDIGNDILTGNGGADTYVIGVNSGNDIIADFENPGNGPGDTLQIDSSLFGNEGAVLAQITYGSSTATLDLGFGNSLTFVFAAEGRFITEEDIVLI